VIFKPVAASASSRETVATVWAMVQI
jgi:hypothetical protein